MRTILHRIGDGELSSIGGKIRDGRCIRTAICKGEIFQGITVFVNGIIDLVRRLLMRIRIVIVVSVDGRIGGRTMEVGIIVVLSWYSVDNYLIGDYIYRTGVAEGISGLGRVSKIQN